MSRRQPNLRSVNLNLLVVFNALMKERNVTRAGRVLGLSQSAVSNALAQLREILDDRLFVRVKNEMVPSSRALDLAAPIQTALDQLQTAMAPPHHFSAANAQRTFRLGMTDYASVVFLPAIVRAIRREAPGVTIRVIPLRAPDGVISLNGGEIDLCIGLPPETDGRLQSRVLLRDSWACVYARRETHLTLEKYLASNHVSIDDSWSSHLERALRDLGRTRRKVVDVPSSLVVPSLLVDSDLVATLPRLLARELALTHDLVIAELPFAAPTLPVDLTWHARMQQDPAFSWLRGLLHHVGAEQQRSSDAERAARLCPANATHDLPRSHGRRLRTVTLRLNWAANAEHAMHYVGVRNGFYAEEGIDLKILPGTGSVDTVNAVAAGIYDFGIAVADAVAVGRGRGAGVVSAAVILQQNPNAIAALKHTGIVKPTDLHGKTVAVNTKATAHASWLAFAKAAGLDASRIRTLDLGSTNAPLELIIGGHVDAAVMLATNEIIALQSSGLEINRIDVHDYGVHSYGQVLCTTQQMARTEPDLVRRMVRATLKSLEYATRHVPEAIEALHEIAPDIDVQTEMNKWQEIIPRLSVDDRGNQAAPGSQTTAGWAATVGTFRAAGLIDKAYDPRDLIACLD